MTNLKTLERKLKTLGCVKRLEIMKYLRSVGSAYVYEIAKEIGISEHATSKHLRILALSNILTSKKRGLFVTYRLALPQEKLVKQVMQSI